MIRFFKIKTGTTFEIIDAAQVENANCIIIKYPSEIEARVAFEKMISAFRTMGQLVN